MNTILAIGGVISAFWIASELVLEWNEPLLGMVAGVALFVALCVATLKESESELRSTADEARKMVRRMRKPPKSGRR